MLAARPAYPPTPVRAVTDTLHGRTVTDPYRWLEDGAAAEVEAWTEAQNAFTRSVLDAFPGRAALTASYEKVFAVNTDAQDALGRAAPVRRAQGRPAQPADASRCVELGSKQTRTAIDPNGFSADGTVALDWWYPSPDGALRRVRQVRGRERDERAVRARRRDGHEPAGRDPAHAVRDAWRGIPTARASSTRGIRRRARCRRARRSSTRGCSTTGSATTRRRIRSSSAASPGAPIQEFRVVYASSDEQWHFLYLSTDWSKNDLYVRPAGAAIDAPWTPVAQGLDGLTSADAFAGRLYLLTNVGARALPHRRAPTRRRRRAWTDVVPEGKGVIESFADRRRPPGPARARGRRLARAHPRARRRVRARGPAARPRHGRRARRRARRTRTCTSASPRSPTRRWSSATT